MIRKLQVGPEGEKFLRNPDACGGTLIVGPDSRILAGPMGPEEGILYAECNLEVGIGMKLRHDFAGHYNRPDVFQLHVNRSAPQLYRVSEDETDAAGAADTIVPPGAESTDETDSAPAAPVDRGAGAAWGKRRLMARSALGRRLGVTH